MIFVSAFDHSELDTVSFLYWGIKGKGDGTCVSNPALLDLYLLSAHLVTCESKEPTGFVLTRYYVSPQPHPALMLDGSTKEPCKHIYIYIYI